MPVLFDSKGETFSPLAYQTEKELEAVVVALSDQIFGPSTVYIEIKKRISGKGIIGIPDGYLIDMTEPDVPKLFVIEVEIVGHDPFKHIGIQMLKFVTSFDDAKLELRNLLMDEVQKERKKLSRMEAALKQSSHRNIDAYLDHAVYSDFRGLVVIDEVREELNSVLEKINANISVIELKSFRSESGKVVHQFDTLYDLDEAPVATAVSRRGKRPSGADLKKRLLRRAASDTVIVPAREEGFKAQFLGNNQWFAIRVGAAMKEKLKYIAAYQVAPVSAITHIAEIEEIKPYRDTGKYMIKFRKPAEKLQHPIRARDKNKTPQSSVYVRRDDLINAQYLDDALEFDDQA